MSAAADLDELRAACAATNARLGPPATELDLGERERRWGVGLPDDAREVVLTLGEGCVDGPPGYGWIKFGESYADLEVQPDPAKPFPLTETWVWEFDAHADDTTIEPVWNQGWLPLGNGGCGMHWALIVAGAARGQVWQLNEMGALPYGGRPGLTGWLLDWLDAGPLHIDLESGEFILPAGLTVARASTGTDGLGRVHVDVVDGHRRPVADLHATIDDNGTLLDAPSGRWAAPVGLRRDWTPPMTEAASMNLWGAVSAEVLARLREPDARARPPGGMVTRLPARFRRRR